MHEPHPPRFAGSDAGAHLAHERVKPVDERYRRDRLARPGGVDQRACVLDRGGQRLLADDGFAVLERQPGQRRVGGVGRADVHDVDVGGSDEFLSRSAAASAPSRSAASRAACGVWSATLVSRPPAARTA